MRRLSVVAATCDRKCEHGAETPQALLPGAISVWQMVINKSGVQSPDHPLPDGLI